MPAEESEGGKPTTTSGTRLVERASAPTEGQPSQVLMQRVIALSGVVEVSDKPSPQPILVAPQEVQTFKADLSATSLEWGGRPTGSKAQSTALQIPNAPGPIESKDNLDAEWATHSSISLELCDDTLVSQRLLALSLEDAVTKQYSPAAPAGPLNGGATTTDHSSLDRVLEAAKARNAHELELVTRVRQTQVQPASPAPRVLVIPAALAWTVAGAFSVCALALAYLLTAFLACGQPSRLDPIGLRCVDRADVAKAR